MSDNGWHNYATRIIGEYIDNDEPVYEHWTARAAALMEEHERDRSKAADALAEELESHWEEQLGEANLEGPLYDFAHNELASANWWELAQHLLEGQMQWVAMWNMPGSLPEMEPMRFDSPGDAQAAIIEEFKRQLTGGDIEDDDARDELIAIIDHTEAFVAEFTIEWAGYVYSVTQE